MHLANSLTNLRKGSGKLFVVAKSAAAGAEALSSIFVPDTDGVVRYFATLQSAHDAATASRGDTIVVAEGHTESVTTAGGITLSKAGITYIFLGTGASRPTFTFSSSTSASILISGASCKIIGYPIMTSSINAILNPIDVTGNGFDGQIEWQDQDNTHEAVTAVRAVSVSNFNLDLVYKGFTAGSAVVRAVSLNGVTGGRIKMDAYGVVSVAWVNFVSVLSTNVEVTGTFYTQGITDLSRNVVDTITGSKWGVQGYDASSTAGYFTGGSGFAVTGGSLTSLTALAAVPNADVTTNTNERDVIGNKSDAAVYTVAATKSIEGYVKGILNSHIMATGTFTTSSTTVPADSGRSEADNYWKGCRIIPITGSAALQPRTIASFANAGGVFTLDSDNPFTAAPGAVVYVIIPPASATVPAADSTANTMSAHVIGNKTDAAVTTIGTTKSLVGMVKGLMTGGRRTSNVALANTDFTGTVTRFTITNGPIKVWSLGLLITTGVSAGANTLLFSFTPTGGAATNLCAATDTASAGAQQLFVVDGTKATALVKTTDVGILAAGQIEHEPIILGSGVLQTIFSAGAPAAGIGTLFLEWEPLNTAATVA